LIVPQFTLYADCRHGNRPNFIQAGKPNKAEQLFNYFTEYCRSKGKHVETGIFGADMKVSLTNDGPFTLVLE
ncbi:MAG: D-aminoacyl-tRNA deacylase, partial [Ruminococcus sp.]|nr:D-aminoacyl-tRNA deacylase [Ruminococcus sp.]